MVHMKSVSVASIGLAWIKGSFELMCFEGILFFITGDFIADTLWNSDWLMLVLRTISMALIAAQVGYLAGVSANRDELANGACSALLTSLWLIVVFLHDRWSMSSELSGHESGNASLRSRWRTFRPTNELEQVRTSQGFQPATKLAVLLPLCFALVVVSARARRTCRRNLLLSPRPKSRGPWGLAATLRERIGPGSRCAPPGMTGVRGR